MIHPHNKRQAFTLIEVLLSLGIAGLLLAGSMVWFTGIVNSWGARTDGHFFDQHIEGVMQFLNTAISLSEPSETAQTDQPISWQRPEGYNDLDEPLLSFNLKEAPPLLASPGMPSPGVTCYLKFEEGEGLFLLWFSKLFEIEELEDINQTRISTFVTQIEYCYYDAEMDEWEIEPEPRQELDDSYPLPNFLKIHFTNPENDSVHWRPLFIPQQNQTVPLF